jgi:hypothetical protein
MPDELRHGLTTGVGNRLRAHHRRRPPQEWEGRIRVAWRLIVHRLRAYSRNNRARPIAPMNSGRQKGSRRAIIDLNDTFRLDLRAIRPCILGRGVKALP